MIKVNKSGLRVLDFNNGDNYFNFILEDMFWYDGDGVYVVESGSRGEMDIKKVEVDSNGNFEVLGMEDLKKIMGEDDDMIMSEFDNGIYSVVVGDEEGYEYFYFKKK
jgi:hypothetical protein